MEAEHLKRLGALYRQAKAGDDRHAVDLVEAAMSQLVTAEASLASMMTSESLAIETLAPGK
jgi:hypothetical protein